VLLLCLASSAAGRSCHRKVPNVVRDQILRFHNDLRARLARGEVDGANGKLKPAKNMYELEWDCDLEYKAQKRCKDGWIDTNLLYNNGVVSDIVIGPSCLPQPLDFNRDFKRPMEKWWKQSRSYAQPNDNRLNDVSLEDFGQMANANATKIGCSFSKKGRLTAVMCIYDSRMSVRKELYKLGDPCKTDAECTYTKDSKCVKNGLCKA
ncbi:SCP-like protein, partial [Ancylostoma ceylanicum]